MDPGGRETATETEVKQIGDWNREFHELLEAEAAASDRFQELFRQVEPQLRAAAPDNDLFGRYLEASDEWEAAKQAMREFIAEFTAALWEAGKAR